jgi:hypothetical protein
VRIRMLMDKYKFSDILDCSGSIRTGLNDTASL